jgi:hypothetical protein
VNQQGVVRCRSCVTYSSFGSRKSKKSCMDNLSDGALQRQRPASSIQASGGGGPGLCLSRCRGRRMWSGWRLLSLGHHYRLSTLLFSPLLSHRPLTPHSSVSSSPSPTLSFTSNGMVSPFQRHRNNPGPQPAPETRVPAPRVTQVFLQRLLVPCPSLHEQGHLWELL